MGRYSLELELAERLGLPTAAVYDRLCDLCLEEGHVERYDGRSWVRLGSRDFPRVFPFLSGATVYKAFRKLIDEDLVRKVRRGDGSWYTVT